MRRFAGAQAPARRTGIFRYHLPVGPGSRGMPRLLPFDNRSVPEGDVRLSFANLLQRDPIAVGEYRRGPARTHGICLDEFECGLTGNVEGVGIRRA